MLTDAAHFATQNFSAQPENAVRLRPKSKDGYSKTVGFGTGTAVLIGSMGYSGSWLTLLRFPATAR